MIWRIFRKILSVTFPLVLWISGCSIHPFEDETAGPHRTVFFGDSGEMAPEAAPGNTASSLWIANRMDLYHNTYDVYSDFGSGGNNFVILARMGDSNSTINGEYTNDSFSGDTSIKVNFKPGSSVLGMFLTSTAADGKSADLWTMMVSGEALPHLALRDLAKSYTNSLKFADSNNQTTLSSHKYDFNTDRDGMYAEGTGFIALAYLFHTNIAKGTNVIHGMTNANRGTSGSLYASSKDLLTTGYIDNNGSNFMIYRRMQVAPTALAVMAERKKNPFWIGSAYETIPGPLGAAYPNGFAYLTNTLDQYHRLYYVYQDANQGGNHFDHRGWMGYYSDPKVLISSYTEAETNVKYSGLSSIKVVVNKTNTTYAWAGLYYMIGVLTGTNRSPEPNWGNFTNAGVSLTGATTLTFYARGATGTENVDFFLFGVGRSDSGGTNINPATGLPWKYPDSNKKILTNITLTNIWKAYTISISAATRNYALGGFGWAIKAKTNATQTFYLDEIRFNVNTTAKPRLLATYTTANTLYSFDRVLRNMSYTYDNSLACLAFLSVGDTNRAKAIADAFVYAQTNDRYYTDKRLRNAYMSGDLTLPAGWNPNGKSNTVRMPGWWDEWHFNWYEDSYAVGTTLDSVAWAMLALISYYQKTGSSQAAYLTAAQNLGNWVENNLRDTRGDGGYKFGFTGWEPVQTADLTKSVTGNSALYAAFKRLYDITGNATWNTRAQWARSYILSMWSVWSGWYFQNGQLTASGTNLNQAITNWGHRANAGVNLTGATKLEFYAKGATGTEKVEFFMGGIGRDPISGVTNAPYPDSASKTGTGIVNLTTAWTKYTIDLTGKNLSYVLGGFGFALRCSGTNQVNFSIDDIKYNKVRTAEKRLIVSYDVNLRTGKDVDRVLKNSAFIYDNAMAVLAFLVVGETERARFICDALLYAQTNDRFYTDKRLRNAYTSGEMILWPGWYANGKTNTMRIPGWWISSSNKWFEDKYMVGTATGNVAWVMLALLAYYQMNGGPAYLAAVTNLGNWVYNNMYNASGRPGFMGGYDGWEPVALTNKLTYKSTEHNLDLFAAYQRLYNITGEAKWQTYANIASNFVYQMWDGVQKCFYTGTGVDGTTINKNTIPLDTQVWTHLALRTLPATYRTSFAYAETNHQISNLSGYDFDTNRDGMWFEGTGQMATGYMLIGNETKAASVMNAIATYGKQSDGSVWAANRDELTTGFDVTEDIPWYYYKRKCIGATTWYVMGEKRVNAFWLGTGYGIIPPPVTNTYGIFTESVSHSNSGYVFATGGQLAVWDGKCAIQDTNSAAEGTVAWSVKINAGDWFGWGVYKATATNMSVWSGGSLSFKIRSGLPTPLKVGIKSTGQEAWVNLSAYGFQTNNTWQTITIPMSAFKAANANLNFGAMEYFFMMAQAAAPVIIGSAYSVDDIYWLKIP